MKGEHEATLTAAKDEYEAALTSMEGEHEGVLVKAARALSATQRDRHQAVELAREEGASELALATAAKDRAEAKAVEIEAELERTMAGGKDEATVYAEKVEGESQSRENAAYPLHAEYRY